MLSSLKKLAAAASAVALCASPTVAQAASTSPQPINPLVAVGVFGTQASAEVAYPHVQSAAGLSGAAVAVQGPGYADPPQDRSGFGIHWLLIALDVILVVWGVSTLFDDDDGDGAASPA